MAVRIRKNGDVVCAAMTPPEAGDTYVDDGDHYQLSVERKLLVTEKMSGHLASGGRWWWRDEIPEGVVIDPFYLET